MSIRPWQNTAALNWMEIKNCGNPKIMKRLRTYLVAIVLLIAMPLWALAQAGSQALPALIPLPVTMTPSTGSFIIDGTTKIVVTDSSLNKMAGLLNGYVLAYGNKPLSKTTITPGNNFISLSIDSTGIPHKEGYLLHVDKKSIRCIGHDASGVLYGLQTLRQLWHAGANNISVPGYTLK